MQKKNLVFFIVSIVIAIISMVFIAYKISETGYVAPSDPGIEVDPNILISDSNSDSQFGSLATSSYGIIDEIAKNRKDQNTTLTNSFSKDLFSQFLQNKNTLTTDDARTSLVADTLARNNYNDKPITYDAGQVKIVGDSNTELMQYTHDLNVIFKKDFPANMENEDKLLGDYVNTQNKKILDRVTLISQIYSNAVQDFLKISVPKKLATNHLLMVNGMSGISFSLSHVVKMETDPIYAATGWQYYNASEKNLSDALFNFGLIK